MTGPVIVDANLLLLLVIGSASTSYIGSHKRLRSDYTADDFEFLGLALANLFSDILLLPHVLAEVSNFARQGLTKVSRLHVQDAFRRLVENNTELRIASRDAVRNEAYLNHGLTDAVLFQACSLDLEGRRPSLLTADRRLAAQVVSRGLSAFDYRELRDKR